MTAWTHLRHGLSQCLVMAMCVAAWLCPAPARAADAVTEWTLLADRIGQGYANWRTLAIMHMAIHDTVNAVTPKYARWTPAAPDEPSAEGVNLEAAIAAAAHAVVLRLHPDRRAEADELLVRALGRSPDGAGEEAGIRLGEAIGAATAETRVTDGWSPPHAFPVSDVPGRWRPTPPPFAVGRTTNSRPYLFATVAEVLANMPSPPEVGSEAYNRDTAETRRLGAAQDATRTPEQTAAAVFWAYQSSQRGFVRLGVDLLDDFPRPGGLAEHARIMSQLTAAMADSAILVWAAKERFAMWRPITAINLGSDGVPADPAWAPVIETPAFPEYPSGHASDCFVGALVLRAVFPDMNEPIVYTGPGATDMGVTGAEDAETPSMGQHSQGTRPARNLRGFAGLEVAARECSESRIWAGAHYRFGAVEAERLAGVIARKAASAVPALP